jgi:hypothetical protein
MKTITVDGIMGMSPCYTRERVEALFGRRKRARLDEILDREDVRARDRIWLAIRMLDARRLRLFACRCARLALDAERAAGREPDARSWAGVAVAERHADGAATDDELRAARAAAESAVWAAAESAVWAAAESAARAARAAAGESAVWVRAESPEREAQIKILKELATN